MEERDRAAEDFLDLDGVQVDPACAVKISPSLAMRKQILPLSMVSGRLHLAAAAELDAMTLSAVRRESGCEVEVHLADAVKLRAELLKVYGDVRAAAPGVSAADDPVAIVDGLLRAAMLRHSSDIHFDPAADSIRVRFRTDGELEEITSIPSRLQSGVTSRLKVLAGLDIAERRAPQDGAFTWRMAGKGAFAAVPLDIRVATLPVRHGERITLRLLEADGGRLSIDRLGLAAPDRAEFDGILASPHGLVLLTGPTGSGKTTTLYAAITSLLQRRSLNVLTVEDPIEYEIPGVSQAEVDSSDKVNFAKALKSLLRHDPDVVMIGEIRDSESLDTAVKAALTGHLVLSTLHTNDAVSAVTRLGDMGLEPHLTAATLRLAAAQRLVRALCPHCREEYAATPPQLAALHAPADGAVRLFRSRGCLACAGRGYRGRTGLFELFAPTREIASMIAAGVHEAELLAAARAGGMRTLADDAREKCLAGVTSFEEAVRAIGG